jgi:elongation factor G
MIDLMARYLEDGVDPTPQELHAPFEAALRSGHLIPILFVSAKTGAGVPQLLDALAKLAPNPAEGNPPPFYRGEAASNRKHLPPSPMTRCMCWHTCSRW